MLTRQRERTRTPKPSGVPRGAFDLTFVPPDRRHEALKAIACGNAALLVPLVPDSFKLLFVSRNVSVLKSFGIYEKSLVVAYRLGLCCTAVDAAMLRFLFDKADRSKMLAIGFPLPDAPLLTLYRGVRGPDENSLALWQRGVSWTPSLDLACWFAVRPGAFQPMPFRAIYRADVPTDKILYRSHCDDDGSLLEYITTAADPERMTVADEDMVAGAARAAPCRFLAERTVLFFL